MELLTALFALLVAPPRFDLPAVHRPAEVLPGVLAALTVEIGEPVFAEDGSDACGPYDLDVRLTRSGGSIGEVEHEASAFGSSAELRAQLKRFKDARKDRRVVLVSVADDVDHAAVVAAVDAMIGTDLTPHMVFTPPVPWREREAQPAPWRIALEHMLRGLF